MPDVKFLSFSISEANPEKFNSRFRNKMFYAGVSQWFLFDLVLYIPVNNLSVMSGRIFLGWTSTKLGLMFCSRTQRSGAGEAGTPGPSVSSQAL